MLQPCATRAASQPVTIGDALSSKGPAAPVTGSNLIEAAWPREKVPGGAGRSRPSSSRRVASVNPVPTSRTVGEHDAVVPSIRGRAWITGYVQHRLQPEHHFPMSLTG
jgi:hypothetical protein